LTSQPQLLQIPLDPGDVVYTPDWVARDMVEFFKPSGRILEPCAGDGVFLKYLPDGTEWCEIEKGRDFFAWNEQVDWIVGNPPYAGFREWNSHSFKISKNIVYLFPVGKLFNSVKGYLEILRYGGIVHMRLYGTGNSIGWDLGFLVGAVHFQRGYTGPMYSSIYK
jgi:hypothetical protein